MWAEKLNLCTSSKGEFILGASFKDMNLCQGSVDRYVYTDTGGWVSRSWDFFLGMAYK